MARVDYDGRISHVYAKGRALGADALSTWSDAFARRVTTRRPLTWADVGSGTGRFTPTLADTFGGPVYGIEPSEAMRAVAEADAAHPAVEYLAGRAEAIPLPDGSCDAALLFFVWHHVVDRSRAVRELVRIIRPGGKILVRSNYSDRMPELMMYDFFPRAREVDAAMYPTFAEMLAEFAEGSFVPESLDTVRFRVAASGQEAFERFRLRAISTFEHLDEDEIEAGFTAMESAVRAAPDSPVYEEATLLTLTLEV